MVLYIIIGIVVSFILVIALLYAFHKLGWFRDNNSNGSSSSSTDYVVMTGLM